ncbi:hypothetical protein P8452_11458 [Trifolium repens]|nr:hypothetical protein P8452_11458 [Trifolium repens]
MTLFCRYCRDMHIHNFTKKSLFCRMLRALGAMVVCFTILTPILLGCEFSLLYEAISVLQTSKCYMCSGGMFHD